MSTGHLERLHITGTLTYSRIKKNFSVREITDRQPKQSATGRQR